jgi:hypothetical protein
VDVLENAFTRMFVLATPVMQALMGGAAGPAYDATYLALPEAPDAMRVTCDSAF